MTRKKAHPTPLRVAQKAYDENGWIVGALLTEYHRDPKTGYYEPGNTRFIKPTKTLLRKL